MKWSASFVMGLVMFGLACSEPEMIPEPFASLIPACADVSMDADWENEHRVKNGELGLSYLMNERVCRGEDRQRVGMWIREFENEGDAHRYATTIRDSSPGCYIYDMKEYAAPSLPVDDFEAYATHDTEVLFADGFEENEGWAAMYVRFRRGRYVGTYAVFGRGEIARDEIGIPFFVLADIPPELVERLMNDTLARWSLP